MFKTLLSTYFILVVLILSSCCIAADETISSDLAPSQTASPAVIEDKTPTREEQEQAPERVSLVAVGDNLLHMPIVRWCITSDGYDFNPLYKNVKDLVQAADMAFVNQEGPLGGEDYAPSDYPYFNSPQEAGRDLASAGFSVVSQANNHGLDQGAGAVLSTVNFWEEKEGVTMIGMNRSEQDRQRIDVVEVRGFRFAWLAYSYGTNGMPMQDSYLMNLIDMKSMADDIMTAKESADAVIVSMHWGSEYQFHPSPEQLELAQFLADQGVLLVIGHHPHVIQPLAWVEGRMGNQTLVAYSLGNFISSQGKRDTMLEGMLSVTFDCSETGIFIKSFDVLPLIMHYENGGVNYCVYPVYEYTEHLAHKHCINLIDDAISLKWIDDISKEVWGDYRILQQRQLED